MTIVRTAEKKSASSVTKKKQLLVSAIDGASEWKRARRNDKMSERLARQIVNDIVSQDRRPGFKFPSENAMVRKYDVSRGTLREAIRLLEVQGLIEVKPGPGGGPIIPVLQRDESGIEYLNAVQRCRRLRCTQERGDLRS